ncbi:MAG: hypothetical protein Kow0088_22760 [Anaerolineales bacterium]
MKDRFHDQVVVITGGNSGIGLATARLFLEEGAKVIITGRDGKRGKASLEELSFAAEHVLFVQADVRRSGDCNLVVQRALELF